MAAMAVVALAAGSAASGAAAAQRFLDDHRADLNETATLDLVAMCS